MRIRRSLSAAVCGLAAFLTAGALGIAPAAAVAKGVPAGPDQYPFAVKLTMTGIPTSSGGTRSSACSGELVSPTWIMTAGHCFHDVSGTRVSGPVPYPTTATLGTSDLATDPGETRNVVEVRQSSRNDIALARLDAAVTDVTPIRLSTRKPVKGQVLTIAGWGATESDPNPSTVLYTGQVTVSAVRTSTVLVVGYRPYPDTSACLYDSGAPYLSTPSGAAPQLVSVESDGPTCPHSSQETTSRADVVVSWVRSVVPDLPAT